MPKADVDRYTAEFVEKGKARRSRKKQEKAE
jgi:hypothetical protein